MNRRSFIGALGGVLVLQGCGKVPFGFPKDPQSPLSKAKALHLARMIATNLGGEVCFIDNQDDSNGPATSVHAFFVSVKDWEGTLPSDLVWFKRPAGNNICHQVVSRDMTSMRTMGMANNYVDADRVTPENYGGTLVASFQYRA